MTIETATKANGTFELILRLGGETRYVDPGLEQQVTGSAGPAFSPYGGGTGPECQFITAPRP